MTDPAQHQQPVMPHGDLSKDKPPGRRWILSLDGGGVRGVITLRCLQRLEQYYGAKVGDMFDLFVGTSTGSIIAALLAAGRTIEQILPIYDEESRRNAILRATTDKQRSGVRLRIPGVGFRPRVGRLLAACKLVAAFLAFVSGWITYRAMDQAGWDSGSAVMNAIPQLLVLLGLIAIAWIALPRLAAKFVTPWLRRDAPNGLTDQLIEGLAQTTLAELPKDIVLVARDMQRQEATFFSAFHNPKNASDVRGNYRRVRVVDAVLASTALPAVLDNYKRFVDGGVGTFGNPAYIGTMEALLYSCSPQIDPRTTEPQLDADGQIVLKNDPTYKEDEVDIWSFGTGQVTDHFTARMLKDRKQVDFWLKYLITEGAPRASSEQQNWLLRRHPVLSKHFKRFNLFINEASLSCLGCPKAAPETFTMESVSNAQFAEIDQVGEAFAQHLIMNDAFGKQGGEEFGERTPGGFNIPAYVKGVLSEFANPRL